MTTKAARHDGHGVRRKFIGKDIINESVFPCFHFLNMAIVNNRLLQTIVISVLTIETIVF